MDWNVARAFCRRSIAAKLVASRRAAALPRKAFSAATPAALQSAAPAAQCSSSSLAAALQQHRSQTRAEEPALTDTASWAVLIFLELTHFSFSRSAKR